MSTYEILNQLPEGTDDFEIVTTFKGFPKSSRRSGHTTPGPKEVEIINLTLEPKVNKTGRNVHLEVQTAGDNVVLHKYMPVPLEESDNDAGYRMWRQLVESVLSWSGKLDESLGRTAGVKSKQLLGKRLAVQVEDGTGDYRDTSVISRFISRDEFQRLNALGNSVPDLIPANSNGNAVGKALFQ